MTEAKKAWLIILITILLTLYGFSMRSVAERNFDLIQQTYPDIAIDTTIMKETSCKR